MLMTPTAYRHPMKLFAAAAVLMVLAAPLASAQEDSRPMRLTAFSGTLSPRSSLIVDPAGTSDTRLAPASAFGVELQYRLFSLGSLYGGVAGAFSSLEHGDNLGVVAGPGSSNATIILGTAGILLEGDWFSSLQPTLRLGGGLKAYRFSTNGASSYAAFSGDVGVGVRASSGAIGISAEVRYLPSSFDQGKLPLRGLTPQDQQQNDLLFTIGVTVRP
jgi:hypothetical protein